MKPWNEQAPLSIETVRDMYEKIMKFSTRPSQTVAIPIAVGSLLGTRAKHLTYIDQVRAEFASLPVRTDDTVGLTYEGHDVLCWLAGHEVLVHPDRLEAFDASFKEEP